MEFVKALRNKYKREAQKVARLLTADRHLGFHYSQFGEDAILLGMFPKRHRGFYVDIGAHHPRRWSNTYLLYLRHWRGINVDANEGAIAAFRRERPGDVNLHCAVAGAPGTVTLYQFDDHAIDTISPTQAARYAGTARRAEVPARTLADILAAHLPAGQAIDLLNVDVEGAELEILAGLDFAHCAPDVICVEIHDVDFDALPANPVYRLLRGHGYRLLSFCWYSAIFRRQDASTPRTGG